MLEGEGGLDKSRALGPVRGVCNSQLFSFVDFPPFSSAVRCCECQKDG